MKLVRELLLSFLIALYLAQVIIYLCPSSDLQQRLVAPGKFFFEFWGLNQSWRLFSPTIRDVNFHLMVLITFDDGTIMKWDLPRMNRWNLLKRFRLEKFRKWDVDALPWPKHQSFWPAFARWAGRLYASSERKPVQLSMHLYTTDIPKPEGELVDRYQLPENEHSSLVFTYFYKPEDFE